MKTSGPTKRTELEDVVRVARALPEDARVPYAFEKRIMALLQSARPADVWAVWSRTMWRAAVTCLAISIVMGAMAQFGSGAGEVELLASDLEQAVLAPITLDETW